MNKYVTLQNKTNRTEEEDNKLTDKDELALLNDENDEMVFSLPSCLFLRRCFLLWFITHAVTTERMIAKNRKHTPAITPAIRG